MKSAGRLLFAFPLAMSLGSLGSLGSLTGCAFFTSPNDYGAYRATHAAPTFEARLEAASRYLREHPDGVFRDEVEAYFKRAEPVFFEAKKGSRDGLKDYLAALPNGPHRVDAEAMLRSLEATERAKRDEASLSAAEIEQRLGRAAGERARVRESIEAWIERFLDTAVYKSPLFEAKRDLILAWSLSLPWPKCASIEGLAGARRCDKIIEMPYTVPVRGGVAEVHQATIEIAVMEDGPGVPLQITVGGPALFLRLAETFVATALDATDGDARKDANSRAVKLVEKVFARAVSADAACKKAPDGASELALACKGMSVTVKPAQAQGEDDLIVIAPE